MAGQKAAAVPPGQVLMAAAPVAVEEEQGVVLDLKLVFS